MNNTENNKLIAEFMGFIPILEEDFLNYNYSKEYGDIDNPTKEFKRLFIYDQAEYDSSWDWLMPVVDRIEVLNYDVQIGSGMQCRIWDIDLDRKIVMNEIEISNPTKISCVFEAVIEFINWYNKNKKP